MRFFCDTYVRELQQSLPPWDRDEKDSEGKSEIKWTRALKALWSAKTPLDSSTLNIAMGIYRPFVPEWCIFDARVNEMQYQLQRMFPRGAAADAVLISGFPSAKPFQVFATQHFPSYDTLEKTTSLPRYRYTASGERIDNITDWALKEFHKVYGRDGRGTPAKAGAEGGDGMISPTRGEIGQSRRSATRALGKDDIFHYVYAVLHDPLYRAKYALNLKREFPRIPFYSDFWKWAAWGEALMALHIGYEKVEPWPLTRTDTPDEKARAAGVAPKALLKADRDNGIIRLDTETQLSGIPRKAWDYRLGNRSGLDWILDQYREKTPKDPTIREKFNTYRFADYKEKVIDLLMRVTRVSVETVAIMEAMKEARR